jgi:hypothetical protein
VSSLENALCFLCGCLLTLHTGGDREVPAVEARARRGCGPDGEPCKSYLLALGSN